MIKRIFIFIALLFLLRLCPAQDQQIPLPLQRFISFFNQHQTDSIYLLWNPQTKTGISNSRLDTFLVKELYPLGKIKEASFLQKQDDLSLYKITLEKSILKLSLGIDSLNKIETFLFQPYQKPPNATNPDTTNSPLRESHLDSLIDVLALEYTGKPNTAGLAIGIFNKGTSGYYFYGETIQGNKQLPDQQTLFEIASITKTFTSLLLAQEVVQKHLQLTDSIVRYLPDSVAQNPDLKGITFQQLATHTSGLPRLPDNFTPSDTLDPYKGYDRNALFSYLKNYKAQIPPDSIYEYSNLGYAVLAELLAMKNNLSYHELVQKIICQPLQLRHTTEFPAGNSLPRFVPTYNLQGSLTPHWHFLAFSGAGALKSTITELLKYAVYQFQLPPNALGQAIELTHQPYWQEEKKHLDIGLAWHINTEGATPLFWHNGGTFGSNSFLAFSPDQKIAVAILSNSAESVDEIGLSIIKNLMTERE